MGEHFETFEYFLFEILCLTSTDAVRNSTSVVLLSRRNQPLIHLIAHV
jgi:hypothetical protein